VWDTNLTLCVGQDLVVVALALGRVGTAGPGKMTLGPRRRRPGRVALKTGRPWLSRTTGGQGGRPGPRAGRETVLQGAGVGDQLVELVGGPAGLGNFYSLFGSAV